METELLPTDILCAVLVLAKRNSKKNEFSFTAHNYEIHRIFHKLKKEDKENILYYFPFLEKGPEPFSPLLEQSITNLQYSGILNRGETQVPERVYLNTTGEVYFDKDIFPKLSKTQRKSLEEIANQFLATLVYERRI